MEEHSGKAGQQRHDAAGSRAENRDPCGVSDNGLPLILVTLEAAQPRGPLAGPPPPLVRAAPYDARWTRKHGRDARNTGRTFPHVYAGGPKRLTIAMHDDWEAYWSRMCDMTVLPMGWVLYRHWEPDNGTVDRWPDWVVIECPCMTIDGARRVRAVIDPMTTAMTSNLTIHRNAERLTPPGGNLTIRADAEGGLAGFRQRWLARRRLSGK